jgi:O-methyltransferase
MPQRIKRFVRKVRFVLKRTVTNQRSVTIYYNDPLRAPVLDHIRDIRKTILMKMGDNEAYQVYMAATRSTKIEGDMAEVGVFQGGSTKLICEAKGGKMLHVFDTFEGLPDVGHDDKQFSRGQFNDSLENVKDKLKEFSNVAFYKGLFPQTAGPVKDKRFCFVNLDVDLYQSTKDCLEFFYPRMNKGGIIMSHDYINAAGVRRAFDEFFADKQEPLIELSGTQVLVVKL